MLHVHNFTFLFKLIELTLEDLFLIYFVASSMYTRENMIVEAYG